MDKKKIDINDLYFGIRLYSLSYSSKEARKLEIYNLFNFSRVKWSVARYVTMAEEEKKTLLSDPLSFCFGDTWGRCEYEFMVCPWGGLDNDDKVVDVGLKVDTFEMYVKPNAEYLMSLVNRVSVTSAKKYMSEERKRLRSR